MSRRFTVLECEQRSLEWYQARIGLLTGSCADAILATRKRGTGELAERRDLRRRLVTERVTGRAVDEVPYLPTAMQRGVDLEAAAFATYEAVTGHLVTRIGFVAHTELKTGCSPDGYVNEWEGLIELKCPKSTTHLDYLQGGVVPEKYRGQILHALWLTGAQWCDFVSFDDRFPPDLALFRVRVTRDEPALQAYELAVRLFLSEVEKEVAAIRGTTDAPAEAVA